MVCENVCDSCQIPAVDGNGAGTEVAVQNFLHRVGNHTVGCEHISQRTIFMTFHFLGEINGLVDLQAVIAGESACQIQYLVKAIMVAVSVDQRTQGNGACVDHGVDVRPSESLVAVIEGIKGLACGFHTHEGTDALNAAVQQCLQKNQGLGHALHGELLKTVTGPIVIAVFGGNENA